MAAFPEDSIIIPNYNHEIFLRQKIDVVLNQSTTAFELIILDDCSTERSWKTFQEYA